MDEALPVISVSAREAVNKVRFNNMVSDFHTTYEAAVYVQFQSCAVCCEDFEEYCDEDDDGVWKLKDCVIVNNQVG